MKVRLKRGRVKRSGATESAFQFHEGPIKTSWSEQMAQQQNQVSIP